MNALDRAKKAYASPDAPTRTLRGTEYDAFARITHRLKSASAAERRDFALLARALQDNRTLWTVLADDVASDGNGLPIDLRRQIFGLATFTNRHTSRILAGAATPDALIEINTAIMRGLRRDGGGE